MVDLLHLSRREADLVAVGAVARGSAKRDLLLRQLAGQRLRERTARIRGARHAHGLIDIRTPGERIADGAAEAGRRAAERFDLRRMVVRLVLEHHEPVFLLAADVRLDLDAAGVDLLRFVEILEQALLAELLHADDREIHERDLARRRLAVDAVAILEVLIVRGLQRRAEIAVLDIHHVDGRRERRVAAVVGPVGIDDAQLRDRRRAVLRVAEIRLAELQILEAHGEAHLVHERLQSGVVETVELLEHLDVRGRRHLHLERRGLLEGGLTALDLVDAVRLDLVKSLAIHIADDDDDARRADLGAFLGRHELHALRRRVCRHIVLAGQVLHREHAGIGEMRQLLLIDDVDGRLRENDGFHLFVLLVAESLDIIAVDDAHGLEACEAERLRQVVAKLLRGDVEESLSFFYEKSSHRHG